RRWVQDFLEILEISSAPDEFFENTKLELYQEQVFCFTPKGQIIALPQKATPIDFAYAVHSQVGDTCIGAKVNGRLVSLRYQLSNGDQVEIMTARRGGPSPEWENFVVTGKARACIRRYVMRERRQAALDKGRAMLAKAFRQESVDGSDKVIETVVKTLKQSSLSDLYVAVGSNMLCPQDVVYAVYPELKRIERGRVLRLSARDRSSPSQKSVSKRVSLVGLSGIAVHYAACCHPLPGDKIIGVVTTGKGVTIHVCDCQTLESFAITPDRFLHVDWDYGAVASGAEDTVLIGRLNIVAENNPTVLVGITNIASRYDASLVKVKIINRQNDYMETIVDLQVRDLPQLSSLILGLKGVPGVMQVNRFRL
ncbi:MAG: bifunctional (p)ppGpp synthetase/guanosine-3',5'-bis(diphosphate) 3'-pyrophosphohydrolase, partial [Acetobacter sp.]|nr:bifunctional (p)ppGpp synthetase/guanosine-3',5'-bis(diphosphate) 3'-pyrophosphohydrolase [Acetobacter sp.]